MLIPLILGDMSLNTRLPLRRASACSSIPAAAPARMSPCRNFTPGKGAISNTSNAMTSPRVPICARATCDQPAGGDFKQLKGRTRTVALAFCALHIHVADVLLYPLSAGFGPFHELDSAAMTPVLTSANR